MLVNNLNNIVKIHKTAFLLIIFLVLFVLSGFFLYQKFVGSKEQVAEEVDISFDAEGPYALLIPRRDGNALMLNLKRTSSYDKITYELAYTSQPEAVKSGSGDEVATGGVDRGVVGEVKTNEKKGEYEQEILFGTCSKNICKYDKGVENGTLTLHIRKGSQAFRMVTQWHLQRPDTALGVITSGDGHFQYSISSNRQELSLVRFTIVNDLTGVPKLPEGKQVLGKVYGLNVPLAKDLLSGDVTVELAENPPVDSKLARFSEKDNKWIEMDTKITGSKLSAKADGAGIFILLQKSLP